MNFITTETPKPIIVSDIKQTIVNSAETIQNTTTDIINKPEIVAVKGRLAVINFDNIKTTITKYKEPITFAVCGIIAYGFYIMNKKKESK